MRLSSEESHEKELKDTTLSRAVHALGENASVRSCFEVHLSHGKLMVQDHTKHVRYILQCRFWSMRLI